MDQPSTQYIDLIEQALEHLQLDPAEARGDNPGQWNLKRGTATVWIDIYEIEEQKGEYFQVLSPVMTLPEEKDKQFELFEFLLYQNSKLFGIAFSVMDGAVYLKFIREVEGLDLSEIVTTIGRAGNYCDFFNDKLVKKFGGRRIE